MNLKLLSHPAIQRLHDAGIPFVVDEQGVTIPEGFYKSGKCLLTFDDGGRITAHTRYDQEDPINGFDDLVRLNHQWWRRSGWRHRGWVKPDPVWTRHFSRLGLTDKPDPDWLAGWSSA